MHSQESVLGAVPRGLGQPNEGRVASRGAGSGAKQVAAPPLQPVGPRASAAERPGNPIFFARRTVESSLARNQILVAVDGLPGIHFRELQRTTGIADGVLRHHLRVLKRRGTLIAVVSRNRLCFFLWDQAERKSVQKGTLREQMLALIRAHASISHGELALLLGAKRQTLDYHVAILVGTGAIRLEKSSAGRCYNLQSSSKLGSIREIRLVPEHADAGPDFRETSAVPELVCSSVVETLAAA